MIGNCHYLLLLLLISCSHASTSAERQAQSTQVYLVRHAETAPDGTRDPGLSSEGQSRANHLATLLAEANLVSVIATEYRRTQETAYGPAIRAGLTVEVIAYMSGPPEAYAKKLAERIRAVAPGHAVLVVGHSNTVPALVAALTGNTVSIAEDEYDRLFIVSISPEGSASLNAVDY